ncbi:DNA/RNA helicase domain-containing protein [Malaciobacter sp. WC5094]
MANIYPNSIDLCRSNAEKKVLNRFKNFSNKFHIIQNLPWVSEYVMNLTKRFSPEGEVDFIILHEDYGMLALEIKGGNISYRRHAFFTNGFKLKQDPYEQSRCSAHYLRDFIKNLSTKIVIGYSVAFPDSKKPDFEDFRKKITFDIDDLKDLEIRILEIFRFWKTVYIKKNIKTSNIKENIHLIKNKLLPDSIDPLTHKIEFDNKNWLNLSKNQTDILTKILKSKRFFVSGRAGTGKTIIGIILARLLNEKNEKVLFLTFNVELSQMILSELKGNKNISTMRFHQYLRKFASFVNKDNSLKHEKEILEYLIKTNHNEYDVLIIDEAQSLALIWLNLLSQHFQNKKIFIFSDELQSFANEGNITNQMMNKIFHFDDSVTLSVNYRSPFKVYKRLLEIFDSSIQQTSPRNLDTLDLKEIITDNPRGVVEKNIDDLLNRGLSKDDIVILISSSEGKNIKSYGYKNIKTQTVKKYRGMEKSIVIFILGSVSKKDFNELYVAYSRSTTQTIVIIPERLLSFGKTKFEQILLESELTDNQIKEDIDSSSDKFYRRLTNKYNKINFLDDKLYFSSKYYFLDKSKETFINTLFMEYLEKKDLAYLCMNSWDVKSANLYSTILVKKEYNYKIALSFDYCKDCNTETYKTYNFCLNCNIDKLENIKPEEFLELKILNNPKDYPVEERYSLCYSLRTIGKYYYSFLNENLTNKVLDLLNNQQNPIYLSAIIDLLIVLYKSFESKNKITLEEIKDIDTVLFNSKEKKEMNSNAGVLANILIRNDILKKETKGIYLFDKKEIFKRNYLHTVNKKV